MLISRAHFGLQASTRNYSSAVMELCGSELINECSLDPGPHGLGTEPDKRRCLEMTMEEMSPVMVALTSFWRRGHGEGLAHRPASGRAAPVAASGEPQHQS